MKTTCKNNNTGLYLIHTTNTGLHTSISQTAVVKHTGLGVGCLDLIPVTGSRTSNLTLIVNYKRVKFRLVKFKFYI